MTYVRPHILSVASNYFWDAMCLPSNSPYMKPAIIKISQYRKGEESVALYIPLSSDFDAVTSKITHMGVLLLFIFKFYHNINYTLI